MAHLKRLLGIGQRHESILAYAKLTGASGKKHLENMGRVKKEKQVKQKATLDEGRKVIDGLALLWSTESLPPTHISANQTEGSGCL